MTLAGKTFVFEKQKAPAATPAPSPAAGAEPPATPPDVWKQTKPAAKDLDQTKITDLLTTMSNLKAEKFAEKAFTSGEDLGFSATFGDPATKEQVRFRKSGDVVQAILSGDSGAAVVSTTDYDRVLALIKELAGIK